MIGTYSLGLIRSGQTTSGRHEPVESLDVGNEALDHAREQFPHFTSLEFTDELFLANAVAYPQGYGTLTLRGR